MPEIEVPTEHLHEALHHHAAHAEEKDRWLNGVALSSAIVAALTAVAALLAGMDANKAIILQMQAADQWNYYQAKGVKMNILMTKVALLEALEKPASKKDESKIEEYRKEQNEIREDAAEQQRLSHEHLESHETMAHAVTLFQVSIAVGAVSALARRRQFWYVSLLAAFIGMLFFVSDLRIHARLRSADAALEAKEQAAGVAAGAPAH